MKKTLLVGALSGVFATMAHAQSSVTLYGLIDAGITYTNNQNGHSNWQATDGAVQTSRWGLRGSEDLGGGLKAIFTLENGFNVMNGTLRQNSREFGRQAFVGLSSEQFGTVTLGRQYDSVVDYLGPFALGGSQYGGTFATHPFDNDNLDNSFRVNNTIKFQSVNYAGFKFGGMYGFSNTAGQFSNNRAYSFGASYNWGGLTVAAGYLQLNNSAPSSFTGATAINGNGAVTGDATFAAGRQRTYGGGVSYTFGPATANFVFTQTQLSQAGFISAGNSGLSSTTFPNGIALGGNGVRFTNFEVNGRYRLTPALNLAGGYTYTKGNINGQNPNWQQVNLQTAYSLSKRTDVYLMGEYQHVSSNTANKGTPINADIVGLTASSTQSQVAVTAGIRHRF